MFNFASNQDKFYTLLGILPLICLTNNNISVLRTSDLFYYSNSTKVIGALHLSPDVVFVVKKEKVEY